jgi:hypothetical protein
MMSAEPSYFLYVMLSIELGAFMMQIVDDRFVLHIMNTHRRPPSTFLMWIVM